MTTTPNSPELVTLKIDGKEVSVPKGTNVIEAAKAVGTEIPHYCYHKDLSVAGNCRMCQVKVTGQPKMTIACNTSVQAGMEVATHVSSKEVADAQAATLEFILINHPLDCTVCDQAGHCKLQDYHFTYNAKSSRFLEDKQHKVKAVPLGPTVMLDGERCIMCTRCIRFCDEVTGTSEIGMINRGDKSVIAVSPGRELDNPLSGTVVDLCPVGALTHRAWRFNTRIWFTKQTDSICTGCSTGCNVKVAERDGKIVQVKARVNEQVNKEWMCDEGRYGFERFLPAVRVTKPLIQNAASGKEVHSLTSSDARKQIVTAVNSKLKDSLIFVSPDLLFEEYLLLKILLEKVGGGSRVVIPYKERDLTPVQRILVSPDYASNFRGAEVSGLVSGDLSAQYDDALTLLREGKFSSVFFFGERSIQASDLSPLVLDGIRRAPFSAGIVTDAESSLAANLQMILPGRSVLEKSGLLINRKARVQYTDRVVPVIEGTEPEWRYFLDVLSISGAQPASTASLRVLENERELTLWALGTHPALQNLTIRKIKQDGVSIQNLADSQEHYVAQ